MVLLPGRSDAPSRLIRAQKYIHVLLPLQRNIFRLAPEGQKSKAVKALKATVLKAEENAQDQVSE